jgi:hypothetical protein
MCSSTNKQVNFFETNISLIYEGILKINSNELTPQESHYKQSILNCFCVACWQFDRELDTLYWILFHSAGTISASDTEIETLIENSNTPTLYLFFRNHKVDHYFSYCWNRCCFETEKSVRLKREIKNILLYFE